MSGSSVFFVVIVIAVVVFMAIAFFAPKRKPLGFQYRRKQFFMTKAEHECFDVLQLVVGDKYHIFPQAHLPTFLDYKVYGQKWAAAYFHISQKSVDFVLCDKTYLSPKLAIELDDWSHNRPDRIERDKTVEQIFGNADMPLLRLKHQDLANPAHITEKIRELAVN